MRKLFTSSRSRSNNQELRERFQISSLQRRHVILPLVVTALRQQISEVVHKLFTLWMISGFTPIVLQVCRRSSNKPKFEFSDAAVVLTEICSDEHLRRLLEKWASVPDFLNEVEPSRASRKRSLEFFANYDSCTTTGILSPGFNFGRPRVVTTTFPHSPEAGNPPI
jgi:hypothetical protein